MFEGKNFPVWVNLKFENFVHDVWNNTNKIYYFENINPGYTWTLDCAWKEWIVR